MNIEHHRTCQKAGLEDYYTYVHQTIADSKNQQTWKKREKYTVYKKNWKTKK